MGLCPGMEKMGKAVLDETAAIIADLIAGTGRGAPHQSAQTQPDQQLYENCQIKSGLWTTDLRQALKGRMKGEDEGGGLQR